MRGPVFFLGFLFFSLIPGPAGAVDYSDGRVRLTLHEGSGRFSFFYMSDISKEKYDSFFVDQDPRTSFFSVMINDKIYRLGESSAFRIRTEESPSNPVFVFESAFLMVREEFSFIKTAGSSLSNGIKITVTLENRSPQQMDLGLRFLIDTNLGEGIHGDPPFLTDKRPIPSETAVGEGDSDQWWISRNSRLALMGSISAGVEKKPDLVHFANWKRLNDVPWKTGYSPGRNFNYLPYSIGDSAVCYYYELRPVSRGEILVYTILLAAEDEKGFASYFAGSQNDLSRFLRETVPLSGEAPSADSRQSDMLLLRDLINRIDSYIAGEITITEEELAAMELVISRIKARYGLP
ncbi:MAG: hypothetical protein LBG10_00190 [Treponema sp.]|jgi:hypothetical protein|nr:hypothetical protein [Treponema sp.]